jgi:outer membrane protein assembly factor BamE (lipoprotein component of BamABCDE complex)
MVLKKRHWIGGLMLLSLVVYALWLVVTMSGINHRNFQSIKLGMTEKEVCRILGGPPRDETGQGCLVDFYRTSLSANARREIWQARKYTVAVYFDENNKVVDKAHHLEYEAESDSIYAKIFRWFGVDMWPMRVRE